MAGMPIRRARRNPDFDSTPRIIRVEGWHLRWGRPHGYRGVPRQLRSKYKDWRVFVGNYWFGTFGTLGAAKRELDRLTPEKIARKMETSKPTEPPDTHPWERYDIGSASGKVVAWWSGAQPRENPMKRRNPASDIDPIVHAAMLKMKQERGLDNYYYFTAKRISTAAGVSESACRAALKRLVAAKLAWVFETARPQGSWGRGYNVTKKSSYYLPS